MLKLFHTDLGTLRVDADTRVLGTNVELYFIKLRLFRLCYDPRRTERNDTAPASSETGPVASSAAQRDGADAYLVDPPPPPPTQEAAQEALPHDTIPHRHLIFRNLAGMTVVELDVPPSVTTIGELRPLLVAGLRDAAAPYEEEVQKLVGRLLCKGA